MIYGTFLGGRDNSATSIAVDSTGAAYVGGWSTGTFPTRAVPSSAQVKPRPQGEQDGFIAKLSGSAGVFGQYDLIYGSYLPNDTQITSNIALDPQGNAYIGGRNNRDGTGIVEEMAATPSGSPPVYSFFYRYTLPERASQLAVDEAGALYVGTPYGVSGLVDQAPPSETVYGNSAVTKFSERTVNNQRAIIYRTRLGPISGTPSGLAVDRLGAAYVVGSANRTDMPIVNGQTIADGSQSNVFVTKLQWPSVTVTMPDSMIASVYFTIAGEGCSPGTYQMPQSIPIPPKTTCVISIPDVVGHFLDPFSEYHFVAWTDNGTAGLTRTIQTGNQHQTFTANFDQYHYTLIEPSARVAGTISGAQNGFVKDGTLVTMVAAPNPGFTFVNWIYSPLTYRSEQKIPSATIRVTADRSFLATAVFDMAPGSLPPSTPPPALQLAPSGYCGRVWDSRGGTILDNALIQFPVRIGSGGFCGPVASRAAAASINVTVVPNGPLGYLTIWPFGEIRPFTSLLNALDGRVKANAAIVRLGRAGSQDGWIGYYATDRTDVVVDVNGFFVPPEPGSLAFYPLAPCRVLDTRLGGGSPLAPVTPRTIPVVSSNCNVPASARAYSLNATIVPLSRPFGYLTLWPSGTVQRLSSTLNSPTGTVVANSAIVEAGSGGAINAFATERADLILDINGYFAPPGQPGALNFYPISPCRVMDTRDSNGPLGGPMLQALTEREFNLAAGACGIPADVKAYSLNATAVPVSTLGYLTIWPSGAPRPVVSTLNALDGAITSNAAIVPAGPNGAVKVFVNNDTHLFFDINGYFK